MNFPSVDYSWFGNGSVIALIAIVHVVISHGVAIGTIALMVTMEYRAVRTKNAKLDQLAKKIAKWVLIITTTVGAMTGVGIWFSTTVIQRTQLVHFYVYSSGHGLLSGRYLLRK